MLSTIRVDKTCDGYFSFTPILNVILMFHFSLTLILNVILMFQCVSFTFCNILRREVGVILGVILACCLLCKFSDMCCLRDSTVTFEVFLLATADISDMETYKRERKLTLILFLFDYMKFSV